MTNWCLRYNSSTIACACYYLALTWRDQDSDDDNSWIAEIDKTATLELLQGLSTIFVV
jgi:hypothetical protein